MFRAFVEAVVGLMLVTFFVVGAPPGYAALEPVLVQTQVCLPPNPNITTGNITTGNTTTTTAAPSMLPRASLERASALCRAHGARSRVGSAPLPRGCS